MTAKRCKDCDPESPKRPAPHPGPRCATHHRAALKDRKEKQWAKRVESVYGLTYKDYYRIFQAQGGRCAICQRARGVAKKLAVDHDHNTGLARGLLCSPCNKMLGAARDSVAFFQRAIDYLEAPPAQMFGRFRHWEDGR